MKQVPTNDRSDASVPWWRSRLFVLAVACPGLFCVFLFWASKVVDRETGTLDHGVRDWVFAHRPPLLVKIFEVVTLPGDPIAWGIGAGILMLIVLLGGGRWRALLFLPIPYSLSAGARALRNWFQIPRPPSSVEPSFGFPSGHSLGSMAMAVIICYVLTRERGERRLAWVIAFAIPLAVGVSRVYLGVHWPSDVIGGWLIGGSFAAAICAIYELALRHARGS